MGQKTREQLEKELTEVEHRIAVVGELITRARDLEEEKARESTTGWLMTLCEKEIGTLLAVTTGSEARSCSRLAEKLEQALLADTKSGGGPPGLQVSRRQSLPSQPGPLV